MYVFCISVLGPKKVIKNNGTDVFKRKKLEETLEEFNELQLKDKRLTLKNHFLHREILREKEMAKRACFCRGFPINLVYGPRILPAHLPTAPESGCFWMDDFALASICNTRSRDLEGDTPSLWFCLQDITRIQTIVLCIFNTRAVFSPRRPGSARMVEENRRPDHCHCWPWVGEK